MTWNWLRRHPLLVDLGLVVLILGPTIGAATRHSHPAAGVVLAVAETLPLLWRRQRPLAVVALVTAFSLAMVALGVWILPLQLGIALYTLASTCERRVARGAGIASVVVLTAALVGTDHPRFGDAAARVVFLVAAWLLGDGIGSRRAYVREIEEKAERLERERESESRRATAEEQARIARELHDVVAHNVSMMVVQAGAERRVLDGKSGTTHEVLETIERIGRGALTEMRRLVGMLRSDAGDPLAPQPGLEDLPLLVTQVSEAGLPVELQVEGERRELPVGIELSAYRIVQEALTNALKHAGQAQASVCVRYGVDSLELEIVDDGAGAPVPVANGGHGLVGMRERVALYGGRLDAGRRPSGGFAVRVLLPIR